MDTGAVTATIGAVIPTICSWSAKVVANSICLSVNGRTALRVNIVAPSANLRASAGYQGRTKSPKPLAFSQGIFWISLNVTYLNRLALGDSTSKHRTATRDNRSDSAAIAQMGNSYPYAASYGYSCEYKVAPLIRQACRRGEIHRLLVRLSDNSGRLLTGDEWKRRAVLVHVRMQTASSRPT